jgi:hypothetical protein
MAPRRKRATTTKEARDFKIRLPEDIRQRLDGEVEKTGWPLSRVIVNELADYPALKGYRDFANLIGEMGNVLARYGARIVMHDLSGELLAALDAALEAEGGAQQAALDKVRVLRNEMRTQERAMKAGKK